MKRALILAAALGAAVPAALVASAPEHAPGHAPGHAVVGGWSEVPRARLQTEVGAVARFAVSKLPKPHGALKQIVGAERQVVAGMNYRMILILTDGGRWRVQVWKKLDGTMQLSHFKRDN